MRPKYLVSTLAVVIVCVALLAGLNAPRAEAQSVARGVCLPNFWFLDPATRTLRIHDLRTNLRAQWIRLEVFWRTGEPSEGVYDEAYLAAVAATCREASEAGLKVMLTFFRVPAWASESQFWDDPPSGLSPGYQDFYAPKVSALGRLRAFVEQVGRLCAPYVTAWECWNEPNLWLSLCPQKVPGEDMFAARRYVQILEQFYAGVKAVDPEGIVVGGALGPYGPNDKYRTSPQRFAAQISSLGAAAYMDAFSHHPYQTGTSARFVPERLPRFPDYGVSLKNLNAVTKYFPGMPVYLTEYGYNVKDCPSIGGSSGVGYEKQAEYLTRAYAYAARYSRVQMMIWFLLSDENEWSTGLRTATGSVKPSWYAFSRATRLALGVTPRVAGTGDRVSLTGRLTWASGAGKLVGVSKRRLVVEAKIGGRWLRVRSVLTRADGTFRATLRPKATRSYRVRWKGVQISPVRLVKVR
jgi:hypothetical protein